MKRLLRKLWLSKWISKISEQTLPHQWRFVYHFLDFLLFAINLQAFMMSCILYSLSASLCFLHYINRMDTLDYQIAHLDKQYWCPGLMAQRLQWWNLQWWQESSQNSTFMDQQHDRHYNPLDAVSRPLTPSASTTSTMRSFDNRDVHKIPGLSLFWV